MCRKPCISFKVLPRMFGAKFAHGTNMTEWIMRKPESFDFGSWIVPYHQCQPSTSFNFYKKLIKKHQIESLLEHFFAWTWILPAAFGTYQLDPRCPRLKQNRTKKRIACKSAKMNAMNLIINYINSILSHDLWTGPTVQHWRVIFAAMITSYQFGYNALN